MVSTDSPSNLAAHDPSNHAAIMEELNMYVGPANPQDHRRVAGKAVTILPRPPNPSPIKQTSTSPQSNGPNLIRAQVIAAASQPLTTATVQHLQQQTPSQTIKCQTNKLGSRKMTHEIEEEVLSNWGEHVTEYYEGIRRRVFKKIAQKLNEMLQDEPYYTEKQVENKITYMEKRYKSVKDKYSDFSIDDLNERSMRTQVERMFPLFFKVHEIIGRRTDVSPDSATTAAVEDNGQGIHTSGDMSVSNRGRKRKRPLNGTTQLELKSGEMLPDPDPTVADVHLLEDSDGVENVGVDIDSDGNVRESFAKRRKKPSGPETKRTGKGSARNASPRDSAGSDAVLKAAMKQIDSDERQRKDMLEVMRKELQLKQAKIEIEKKSAQDQTALAKAVELRKLAEAYVGIDEKENAKQLLSESYELLSKL